MNLLRIKVQDDLEPLKHIPDALYLGGIGKVSERIQLDHRKFRLALREQLNVLEGTVTRDQPKADALFFHQPFYILADPGIGPACRAGR